MSGRGSAPAGLSYEQALAYVTGLGRFGVKLGLERIRAILAELGDPHRGHRGALIAGTNGKGSTAAFLEAILRERGLRVGTTPSPHLRSYTERVRLGGQPISAAEFAAAVDRLRPRLGPVITAMGEPTEFELLVALALDWLGPRADRLVIEVGMGGRLDATNVLDLGLAVITNVSLDHRHHLGDTVEQIAAEKAGIIKPGNVVITGASGGALEVVERFAARAGAAELWRLGREIEMEARCLGWRGSELDLCGPGFSYQGLQVRMLGDFQAENAALAVAAAHAMGDATAEAVGAGLASATWPGRLQRAGERLLMDGAHNPAGMRRLVTSVRALLGEERPAVVFGVMADKDVGDILRELGGLKPRLVVFTRAASAGDRALEPAALQAAWQALGAPAPAQEEDEAAAALAAAREAVGEEGWVLVCGSLYLVGELSP
ncbi:MAG TPA: Mur ligase family protein [Candidatus Dormibacteraeota bacterium]|nr:Mur ligase family protein [Candidatus Dormibacteraeota bacterium]